MILVTGGTGLLGSHLLLELSKVGIVVRAMKRKNASLKQVEHVFRVNDSIELLEKIEWVEGDILDVYSIEEALKGVIHVYHCANIVSFNLQDESMVLKTNIEGTANIINACLFHGIEKFCHVSSIAALSNYTTGHEITENVFWKSSPSNSIYSISKYGAEREAWRAMEEGLRVIIVNPSVIMGASVLSTGSNALLLKAKNGNIFYTYGETGFVDAIDVAKVMIRLMESTITNERYIVSSGNISFRDFYTIANKVFREKPPYIYFGKWVTEIVWRILKLWSTLTFTKPLLTKETARAAHSQKKFSNEKIKKLLNYSFISVEESIINACKNFRSK